jgi:hypothetical protein
MRSCDLARSPRLPFLECKVQSGHSCPHLPVWHPIVELDDEGRSVAWSGASSVKSASINYFHTTAIHKPTICLKILIRC